MLKVKIYLDAIVLTVLYAIVENLKITTTLFCTKYSTSVPRNRFFNNIFGIASLHIVNTHVFLWGDDDFIGLAENENLFFNVCVQLFPKKSGQF